MSTEINKAQFLCSRRSQSSGLEIDTHTHTPQCDGISEVTAGKIKVDCNPISCNKQIYLAESEKKVSWKG